MNYDTAKYIIHIGYYKQIINLVFSSIQHNSYNDSKTNQKQYIVASKRVSKLYTFLRTSTRNESILLLLTIYWQCHNCFYVFVVRVHSCIGTCFCNPKQMWEQLVTLNRPQRGWAFLQLCMPVRNIIVELKYLRLLDYMSKICYQLLANYLKALLNTLTALL